MPRLTFPSTSEALWVDATVGIHGQAMANLQASGTPIPPPVTGRGVIDTGSNVTGVSAAILARLGVPFRYRRTTSTFAGQVQVNIHQVSLSLTDVSNATAPMFVLPDLHVMDISGRLADVDVVIGLDVLAHLRFLLDGPRHEFTLDW
jgi:hypothetical protein